MTKEEIISHLPYTKPFHFVDKITKVSLETIEGEYLFKEDEFFYKGHFKNKPITPGVILTECMAQIGLVSFGIFLLGNIVKNEEISLAMSSTDIQFYKAVLPLEKVIVKAEKIYFRFNKLKCEVSMLNENKKIVAKGIIAGMIIKNENKN